MNKIVFFFFPCFNQNYLVQTKDFIVLFCKEILRFGSQNSRKIEHLIRFFLNFAHISRPQKSWNAKKTIINIYKNLTIFSGQFNPMISLTSTD